MINNNRLLSLRERLSHLIRPRHMTNRHSPCPCTHSHFVSKYPVSLFITDYGWWAPGRRHQSGCHFSAPGADITVVSPSTDHGRGRLRTQENNAVRVSVVTRTRGLTPQSLGGQWSDLATDGHTHPHLAPPPLVTSCDKKCNHHRDNRDLRQNFVNGVNIRHLH